MMELNAKTLEHAPPGMRRPGYDRSRITPGIVHLSVSNFHRAHQAWYIDRLLALPGHEDWGICGVGIIDDATERLKLDVFPKQDDLYTLTQYPPRGPETHQIIGSIVEYFFAPAQRESVLERLADPRTKIVSMTITEGGYNMDRLGLYQLDNPAVVAELAEPSQPRTAFGYIVEGLRRRRAAGGRPFTVMSCDNLRGNGEVAKRAVLAHARALDLDLAEWILANVSFPNSMVDRITPAVLKEDAERINASVGVLDRLPVYCEEFVQWVVEDSFCNERPPLERVGAQIVADVHGYELAKVRMLNGAHSMLAYPALLAGMQRVNEAMADPRLLTLLDDFMEQDVIVHLTPPEGMDLHEYKRSILARFASPAVSDQLQRVASDGATKLPVFLGGTFAAVLERGGDHRRLAFLLACFVRYLRGVNDLGQRFSVRESHLDDADRRLAVSADRRAALGMSMLTGFGIAADGPFAEHFLHYSEALEREGALGLLARLTPPPALVA